MSPNEVTSPLSLSSSSSPFPVELQNVTTSPDASRNDTDDERNERLAVIEVAISGTILFLAVVGNSIVVVSLMLKRGKLSRMHLMMLHLSLADLSVAFFQVLPQMVWDITFRFQGGAFMCGAIKYLQLVTMYASSYVLLSTAVDRYVAICRPFLSQKWTSTHAHLLVLAAWIASLVFSLPQIFIFSLSELGEGTGVYDCWANFHPEWTLKLYITWNTLSVFIAPSLTLAVLYGHISYAVWKSSKMAEDLAARYTPVSKRSKGTTPPRQHSYGSAHSSHGKTAWQNHVSTTRSGGNSCSSPLQGRPRPATTRKTQQNSPPGTKPRNGGLRSEASPLRAQTCTDEHDCTELTQIRSAHSEGTQLSMATHSPLDTATDVPPTTRLLSSSITSRSTLGTGSSRDLQTGGSAARSTGVVGISRAKIKTIKLTLTVVICYLVCWTPFYVAQLWAAYDENVPYDNIFFTLVLLLASVNSCTNPWIYMAFSDTIWNTLRAIADSLTCCFRCSSHSFQSDGHRGRHSYKQTAAYRAACSLTKSSLPRSSHLGLNGVSKI